MKGKVVVVIPAFNEERSVARVVERAVGIIEEVIVVDDGSLDRTATLASLDGTVPVIQHPYNIGCGGALRTGIAHAQKGNADIIVLLDADGQHNPEEIPTLLDPILNGYTHLVAGARDFSKMTLPRRASNILTANILRRSFGVTLPDVQCGFRAIRSDVLDRLKIHEDGYPWACEMLINAKRRDLKMASVEIETIRAQKSGISPLRDTLQWLRMMLRKERRES